MGLITKEVTFIPNDKMIPYYKKLGYDCKHGVPVTIRTEDLSRGSRIKIECSCDYCGKSEVREYKTYIKSISSPTHKFSCKNCSSKKREECSLLVHGVSHPMQLETVKEKQRSVIKEKYGVDYPMQSEKIRKKFKENYIKNHGVDNPLKDKEVRNRICNTCKEKYGVENPFSSEIIQEKIKNSNMRKYGVENPMQSQIVKEKMYATNSERYGVEYVLQSKEIMDRMKANNLDKYGVEYVSQLPEVREKAVNTLYNNQTMCTSKQQKYIAELYNMELNYPLLYWSIDIYDKENDICWNYDGGGHWLSVELGSETIEEFNRKELIREKTLRKDGHKIVTITSKNDLLPSDTILLQMLSDAKQYFSDYPEHSWIQFNIDNETMRNAENKDGVPYFYGELRKIKKSDISLSA